MMLETGDLYKGQCASDFGKVERLAERVEQLACIVERMTEPAQMFTEERTSDGGSMILKYDSKCHDIEFALIRNGYNTAVQYNKEEHTITIEFWKE